MMAKSTGHFRPNVVVKSPSGRVRELNATPEMVRALVKAGYTVIERLGEK